jgi:hypothetical protein
MKRIPVTLLLTLFAFFTLILSPLAAQDVLGLPVGVMCPGFQISRLIPNWYAVLRENSPGSNIRRSPVIGADIIGEVPEGERFIALDVPIVCNNDAAWWYVSYGGLNGWMVEGQHDEYWTQPLPLPDDPDGLAEFAASLEPIPALTAPDFSLANGGGALMFNSAAGVNIASIIGGSPQQIDIGGAALPTGNPVSPDGQWVVLWQGNSLQFADRATNILTVSPDLTDLVGDDFNGFTYSIQVAPNAERVILDGQYSDGNNEIFSLERYGGNGWALINLTNSPAVDFAPQLSPDGTQIAFVSDRDGSRDIFIMDIDGENVRNLSASPVDDYPFAWSSDGTQIAYISRTSDSAAINIVDADGANFTPVLVGLPRAESLSWSPDGEQIAYITTANDARFLYTVDLNGDGVTQITPIGFSDQPPIWAPESSFMAFTGLDNGVYIITRSGERQFQIAADGSNIIWMPDYSSQ